MSESSNDARAAAGRSYGDLPVGARPAVGSPTATAAQPLATAQAPGPMGPGMPGAGPAPVGPGPVQHPGPAQPTGPGGPGGLGGSGGGPLSGASASFARVASAVNRNPGRKPKSPTQARVRKARLRVARLDPWSVMKVSFVLSLALGIVTIIGTAVVWNVLNGLGVFSSLNKTVGDLTSSGSGSGSTTFSITSVLSFGHVEGYMMIVALVDVVLVTALATLGAYLYNLAAGFVGGFEVTLAEDQ